MSDPATTNIDMSLVTAWLNLGTLEGFQRAYRVQILGKYIGTVPAPLAYTVYDTAAYATITSTAVNLLINELPGTAEVGDFIEDINGRLFQISAIGNDPGYPGITCFTVLRNYTFPNSGIPVVSASVGVSVHSLLGYVSLQIGYDYDEAFTAAIPFPVVKPETAPVQLEHHIVRQKCEAIRFKIGWSSKVGPLRLTGLTLQLGGKRGIFKITANKRV
jgi:hypothetical protein